MSRRKYIDELDIELLNTISAHPKWTVIQLAEAIDLSPGPTHTRLVRLGEEGFLENGVTVDYDKLGWATFFIDCYSDEDPKLIKDKITNNLTKFNEAVVHSISFTQDIATGQRSFTLIFLIRKEVVESIREKARSFLDRLKIPYENKRIRRCFEYHQINIELSKESLIKRKPA